MSIWESLKYAWKYVRHRNDYHILVVGVERTEDGVSHKGMSACMPYGVFEIVADGLGRDIRDWDREDYALHEAQMILNKDLN